MHLLFENIEEKDKVSAIDDLIHDSAPRPSFFFLVILSMLMAAFGLLIGNAAVIIGSMLIAPILSPIMSLALGIVMNEGKIISRSAYTLAKSTGYGLGCVIIATWIFGFGDSINLRNVEIMSRAEPSIIYLVIAIVAGLATAFARVKPELNETLPGTAIAVALVPPLAVSGIGIATFNISLATGAFQMFILNAIGIVLATMLMFSLMNLYSNRARAAISQEREDKKLASEIRAAEKKKREEKEKNKK